MRILVLEDDFFTALDIKGIVESAALDADVVVCASVHSARAAMAKPFDFAFLDVDVADGKSFAIAEHLRGARTPFVFVSGSTADAVPPALKDAPFLSKPFLERTLLRALEACSLSPMIDAQAS
jgi:DNA-binding LytR/AlgR family response regulator